MRLESWFSRAAIAEAHLGWRSVSGGGLLLSSNNVAAQVPGGEGGGSEFSGLGNVNVNVSVEKGNSINICFPGGAGREQGGTHTRAGPVCCWSLSPWRQPHLEPAALRLVGIACSSPQGGHLLSRRNVWVWLKRVHWKESVTGR